MPPELCVPISTARHVRSVSAEVRHPGLQLDKFSAPGDQTAQKKALEDVCKTAGTPALLKALLERREEDLKALAARTFQCNTAAPLTLHLSRASALENAGICLHPLYGFVYLPGSGLKGMARAYAETIWLPVQNDKKDAWQKIEDVFGWAPNPTRKQQVEDENHPAERRYEDDDPNRPEIKASCGSIIFHDAWPTEWPELIVDIVNNHHSHYYDGNDDKDAPGDWEDPIPVYFLAVPAGVTFSFALCKRSADVKDELLDLARQWLIGALCHLGAGAKTAAGYGCFTLLDDPQWQTKDQETWSGALETKTREEFTATLELVTPAFLAGASQKADDCDLRSSTLRGLLRWWWRTMHAGYVDVEALRSMEAAIWGNTKAGGAIQTVVASHRGTVLLYDYKDRFRPKDDFKRQHQLQDPPDRKTTQGLFYASYGMDETSHGQRKQRYYVAPGARWDILLTARKFIERDDKGNVVRAIEPRIVLDQAKAALWLLCQFGGVGSKSRKGFGSLSCIDAGVNAITLGGCKEVAQKFRSEWGLPDGGKAKTGSATLEEILQLEIETRWKDPWFALDQLGYSVQAFAKQYAHKEEKLALGLPRKIHGPREDGPVHAHDGRLIQDRETWRRPEWLGKNHPKRGSRTADNMRYASPVHYHLAKAPDGTLVIRIAAFPAAHLPDIDTSRRVLTELLKHLKEDLGKRVEEQRNRGQASAATPAPARGPKTTQPAARFPDTNERVKAILKGKNKKGNWEAVLEWHDRKIEGTITNSSAVPTEAQPGQEVDLIVGAVSGQRVNFRWPTGDEKQPRRSQGPRGGGPPRGRRR